MNSLKYFFYLIILILPISLIAQEAPQKTNSNYAVSFFTGYHLMQADIKGHGFGYGIGFRFLNSSILSFNVNLLNTTAKGISSQRWSSSSYGGGLVEPVFQSYSNNGIGWYPSYKSNILVSEIELNLNLSKTLSKLMNKNNPNFDFFISGGLGIFSYKTSLDLLDAEGRIYSQAYSDADILKYDFNLRSDRKAIRNALKVVHDNEYETEGFRQTKYISSSFGALLRFHLHDNFGIGFGYKYLRYIDLDYLDGIKFRTALDQTNENDKSQLIYVAFDYMF